MVVRRMSLMALVILGFVSLAPALDFEGFRQAARDYEFRMMQNVETVVITGSRTTWKDGVAYESTFTNMVKGGRWRRETRTLIPHRGRIIYDGAAEKPAGVHPAPPADGNDSPAALKDTLPKKSPPPAPPAPPAAKEQPAPAPTAAPAPAPTPTPAPPAVEKPAPAPVQPATPALRAQQPVVEPAPATPPPRVHERSPVQPATIIDPSVVQPATQPQSAPRTPPTSYVPYSEPEPLRQYPKPNISTPYSDSMVVVRIFDGELLWEVTNGESRRIYHPADKDFDFPVVPGHDYWRDLEYETAVKGSEVWRTRACYKLESDSARLWVDKDDFFLVALERKRLFDREPPRTEASGFFSIADGYTIPGRIDRYLGDRLIESEYISNVYFNRPLEDGLFQVQAINYRSQGPSQSPIPNPAQGPQEPKNPDKRDGQRQH
ncbi:MAG TPA: hypothetical protein VGL38_01265 [bacterium]